MEPTEFLQVSSSTPTSYSLISSLDVRRGIDVLILPPKSLKEANDGQLICETPHFEYLFALACGAEIWSDESFVKERIRVPDNFFASDPLPDGLVMGDSKFLGALRMLERVQKTKHSDLEGRASDLFSGYNIFYYGKWADEGGGGGGEEEGGEEENEDTQMSEGYLFETSSQSDSVCPATTSLAASMTEHQFTKLLCRTSPTTLQRLTNDSMKTPFSSISETKIILGPKSSSSDLVSCGDIVDTVWVLDSDEIEIVGSEWIVDSIRDGQVQETSRFVK